MKISTNNLIDLFDKKSLILIDKFLNAGFVVTLVGGAVKEFLTSSTLPTDLDFELRHIDDLKENIWLDKIKSFGEILSSDYNVEFLPFGIIRINLESISLEFASPRMELFDKQCVAKGHKDFRALFSSKLTYADAFKRRDLTINAIGLEISLDSMSKKSIQLRDPFSGALHLKQGVLESCGDDYFYDPVRFLRLIRFKIQHKFKFGKSISKKLDKFNLEKLSNFYFQKESLKVPFFEFVNLFFREIANNKIPVNSKLKEMFFLRNISSHSLRFKNLLEVLSFLVVNDLVEDTTHLERFVSFFSIKKALYKDLLTFKVRFSDYQNINFNSLLAKISKEAVSDVIFENEFDVINKLCSSKIVREQGKEYGLTFLKEKNEWREFLLLFTDWDKFNIVDYTDQKIELKKGDLWRISLYQYLKNKQK